MGRGRYRQRRRRRKLMFLGLLAVVSASSLWYRYAKGHYPWVANAGDAAQDTSLMLAAAARDTNAEPVLAPSHPTPSTAQPSTPQPPASQSAVERPLVPTTAPAVDKPILKLPVPTTLPAFRRPANSDPAQAASSFKAGLEALNKEDLISARQLLSHAYVAGLSPADDQQAREKLADIAQATLFTARPFKGDPLCEFVTVQPGDTLAKIAARYTVSEDLLASVNGVKDKNLIRLGQKLKVMHGPWHAVVSKSRHVLDLYLQDKYVRSFRVALGADGSTPTGLWKVANHQEDPGWTDPRTGHRWHPSDPGNPIGEYWIGLEGVDGEALGQYGYGIHGTIEPESIGKDVSMGCIRLAPSEIALTYKLLMPGQSYVAVVD